MQKGRLRVFYTPTDTNCAVVRKLKKSPRLVMCEFLPLDEKYHRRTRQLGEIEGRAALILGDGFHHHESFYFTHGVEEDRIKLKINVDAHSDYDGTKRGNTPGFSDHMFVTEKRGVKVVFPDCFDTQECVVQGVKQGIEKSDGEIALTVDLDGVAGMLIATMEWFQERNPKPAEIVRMMRTLGNRLYRFDICGLNEELLKELRLVKIELGYVPSKTEMELLLYDYAPERIPEYWRGRRTETLNRVGTYATDSIVDMLEAFAQVNGYEA